MMYKPFRMNVIMVGSLLVAAIVFLPFLLTFSSAVQPNSNCQLRICYWIGGEGNVSDVNHWSNAAGNGIPGRFDRVVFTVGSGSGNATLDLNFTSGPVTLNGSMVVIIAGNFTWTITSGITPPFLPGEQIYTQGLQIFYIIVFALLLVLGVVGAWKIKEWREGGGGV